jgi:hypothetical protein
MLVALFILFSLQQTIHSTSAIQWPSKWFESNVKKFTANIRLPFVGSSEQCRSWLVGSYDNLEQSQAGAAKGKFNARDGGHEYVCANIVRHPLLPEVLIAHFFFDNDPTKTFRFRYYEFLDVEGKGDRVTMRLHRPQGPVEAKLKAVTYDVSQYLPTMETDFEPLSGCDVIWKKQPWRRNYRGVLEFGTCQIRSSQDPSVLITVKDDLRLWKNKLWINDRVYNKEGVQLIGNRDGIPYKLRKKG